MGMVKGAPQLNREKQAEPGWSEKNAKGEWTRPQVKAFYVALEEEGKARYPLRRRPACAECGFQIGRRQSWTADGRGYYHWYCTHEWRPDRKRGVMDFRPRRLVYRMEAIGI